MKEYKRETVLNAVSEATEGTSFFNEQGGGMTISVEGTFTGAVIKVQGKQGEEWHDLGLVKLDSFDTSTTATAVGSYAVAGVGGHEYLRVVCTAITSGSVTVNARVFY